MALSPRSHASKVKSRTSLKKALARIKGPVVFTNGCFDLLHKGHVTYLEKARKLGKVLVVALNSDESVKRLKGPSRPINTLADRLDVLAGLESVDFVTWFEEDTPLETILILKPQILVKGGDWKVSQIVGGLEVISWGGKVKSLTYIEGQSTTQMIEKARLKVR
jgi:rfaE bifunctional protein nucleotidyltransferase chain/domain